jgi:hypothetical protein
MSSPGKISPLETSVIGTRAISAPLSDNLPELAQPLEKLQLSLNYRKNPLMIA